MNQHRTNTKGHTLRKAGQLAVASRNNLFQEVNNDDDFPPLSNITTTFIETNSPIHSTLSTLSPSTLPLGTFVKSTPASRTTLPKQQTANDLQYLRLAAELRNNTKAATRSLARKKDERQKMFLDGDEEEQLTGVEHIIGEIQSIMNGTLQNKVNVSFKPKAEMAGRSKKAGWHNKPTNSFSRNEGFSKLEELLLNYQVPAKSGEVEQVVEPPKQSSERLQRRQQREEKKDRNKKYQEVSKGLQEVSKDIETVSKDIETASKDIEEASKDIKTVSKGLTDADPVPIVNIPQIGKPRKENKIAEDPLEEKPSELEVGEQGYPSKQEEGERDQLLRIDDIEIVELDWSKLPVIISPISTENVELFLRMREYPEDQAFLEAITEVLGEEQAYRAYSIYDPSRKAGIVGRGLLSEEEFREMWAEEWSYDVEEEESKELLGEWDFQWYRSLVQLTYSHSLEQILVKDIKYDPQLYLRNLSKIHGPANDKNKTSDDLNISSRVTLNRLKFVEALLTKFQKERLQRLPRPSVILGVIPSIAEGLAPQRQQQLREWVQTMFVGELYPLNEAVMGVVVTLGQARSGRVERLSPGVVRLGGVHLMVNGASMQQKGARILLRRQRLKNSWVHIGVMREGGEEEVLEVGEELHFGRRYRIELD